MNNTRRRRGYRVANRQFYNVDTGRYEWCCDSGYEVYFGGYPEDRNKWADEFIDSEGNPHYAYSGFCRY